MTSFDRASMVRLLAELRRTLDGGAKVRPGLQADLLNAEAWIAEHEIPWAATIHLAQIDHRHGANIYAARDSVTLTAQVAAFCRSWWDEIDDPQGPATLDDETVVQVYFEQAQEEYLAVDTIEIPAPVSSGDLEIGFTLVASTVHISPASAALLDAWSTQEDIRKPKAVADLGAGWLLSVRALNEQTRSGLPHDLLEILGFACTKGCRYLILDRDGPEIDGLSRHDW